MHACFNIHDTLHWWSEQLLLSQILWWNEFFAKSTSDLYFVITSLKRKDQTHDKKYYKNVGLSSGKRSFLEQIGEKLNDVDYKKAEVCHFFDQCAFSLTNWRDGCRSSVITVMSTPPLRRGGRLSAVCSWRINNLGVNQKAVIIPEILMIKRLQPLPDFASYPDIHAGMTLHIWFFAIDFEIDPHKFAELLDQDLPAWTWNLTKKVQHLRQADELVRKNQNKKNYKRYNCFFIFFLQFMSTLFSDSCLTHYSSSNNNCIMSN